MPSVQLPILTLAVREQRYSCHGCGNCCRDFTVQLRDDDLKKLAAQEWEKKLGSGNPITIDFRGQTYLRQREDGSCIFLMDNGLCRVHAEFGFESKPIACQLFPFHLTRDSKGVEMGISFACQSVLENKGAELRTHGAELRRMSAAIPELAAPASPPMLTDRLRASGQEEQSLIQHIDDWLQRAEISLPRRVDGLAWVASSLAKATLENVRGDSFNDLLDVLFAALPAELEHYPLTPSTTRQRRMLRRAVFARTEDPKLSAIEKQGRLRITLSQLLRNRRFKGGKGFAPTIGEGWPVEVRMENIDAIQSANGRGAHPDLSRRANEPQNPIDDLITRYLRATILGGRAWGAGYYGWNMIAGLQALLLNVVVIGWLARLHAEGRKSQSIDIVDVRAALGRVDRTAGRAKWLGGATERLRLTYFNLDDGLRRLIADYGLITD